MEGFPLGPMAKYENSLSRGIYEKRQKMNKKMLLILIQLVICEFETLFTFVFRRIETLSMTLCGKRQTRACL